MLGVWQSRLIVLHEGKAKAVGMFQVHMIPIPPPLTKTEGMIVNGWFSLSNKRVYKARQYSDSLLSMASGKSSGLFRKHVFNLEVRLPGSFLMRSCVLLSNRIISQ